MISTNLWLNLVRNDRVPRNWLLLYSSLPQDKGDLLRLFSRDPLPLGELRTFYTRWPSFCFIVLKDLESIDSSAFISHRIGPVFYQRCMIV